MCNILAVLYVNLWPNDPEGTGEVQKSSWATHPPMLEIICEMYSELHELT